ncbi:MAG: oligosaccharide flippase family protein [Phycisphaerales bacterium]
MVDPSQTGSPLAPAPAMGRTVARGSLWMILQTGATKLAGLAAQVLLGAILSGGDFGIYAIAISLSVFAAVLRDGGVRSLLIQRQREYDAILGPVFWMGLAFNLATGILIAGLGPPAALAYGDGRLVLMLALIGVSIPLSTPAAILSGRLSIELRFREQAVAGTVAALVRYGGAVALALLGFGPLSFVLPLPAMALTEWAVLAVYTRDRPWRRPAALRLWRGMLTQTRWIIIANFAVALYNMGNYSLVGLLVAREVVGVYFFAYQIVLQLAALISTNFNLVLFPAFTHMSGEPDRLRAAVRRSLRQLMLVGVPLGMVLVPAFPHIEALVWRGRWAEAVLPVQLIAIFYPPSVVQAIGFAALQAWGDFRRWAVLLALQSAGMLAVGALAAALWGTAPAIAAATSVYVMLSSIAFCGLSLRRARFSWGEVAEGIAPAWGIGLAAVGGALLIDRWAGPAVGASGLPPWAVSAARLLISGAAFSALFAVMTRVALRRHVEEAVALAPTRLRPLALRVMLLREPPA